MRRDGQQHAASDIPHALSSPADALLYAVARMLGPALEANFADVADETMRRLWEFQVRWRRTFCPHVESWSGSNAQFGWNAFNPQTVAFIEGKSAEKIFEEKAARTLLVTEEPGIKPMYRVTSTTPITRAQMIAGWRGDVYAISPAWDWCFVSTHEDDCGPYFVVAQAPATFAYLEPWEPIPEDHRVRIETEIARELPPNHVLAGRTLRVVAARSDCDDLLCEVTDLGYAVVHATWSGHVEQSREWPRTEIFSSFDDWCERGMKRDHEDYAFTS